MKLSRGASSGIIAFGRTNAPVESSRISGVEGEEGLAVSTTFAKWVGTATLGGEPITSWVYVCYQRSSPSSFRRNKTYHAPFSVLF